MQAAKSKESSKAKKDTPAPQPKAAEAANSEEQSNPVWQRLATWVPSRSGAGDPPPEQPRLSTPFLQRRCSDCGESPIIEAPRIQAKVSVGAPDDEYEREADRVAAKVMRMPAVHGDDELLDKAKPTASAGPRTSSIQRVCVDCEEEFEDITGPAVQAKSDVSASTISVPQSVATTISSPTGGSPLNADVRSRTESVLGADLSGVQVHSGESAQDAARAIKAKAFTHGNHIYLGSGQSPADLSLMAHEATHTVQQGATHRIGTTDSSTPTLMRIPETAGEMRLDSELSLDESELRHTLDGLLRAGDFDAVDAEYGDVLPEGLTYSDVLFRDMPPTLESFNALASSVQSQLTEDYYSDTLSLLLTAFDAQDTTIFSQQCEQVSGTYRNLAYLNQWEEGHREFLPPEGDASEWFHNRSLIFLEFARDSEHGGFPSVLAAMAAEIERTAWENLEGPVDTATTTVEPLFENGISEESLTSLDTLYNTVLDSVQYDFESDEGQAMENFRGLWVTDLGFDLLAIEVELQEEARNRENTTRLDEFHSELARVIGSYLALVNGVNLAARSRTHIVRVEELLRRYGNPQVVPLFLTMFVEIGWPGGEEETDESDESLEPRAEPAPAERAEAPDRGPEERRNEGTECVPESYAAGDLDQWIRLYWQDRPAFWNFRLHGPGLLCGMGTPGSTVSAEEAERRVESMRRIVASALRRLNTLMMRATSRAQAVYDLRQNIFPADDEPQISTEESEGQATIDRPDFITHFGLSYSVYNLLVDAINAETFDPATFIEAATGSFNAYFEPLNYHLSSLRRALELTRRMRDSGAADLLIEEFPDDHGPMVSRLLQTAETREIWLTDHAELERAQGLGYAVSRLTGMSDRAETTIRVRQEQALQEDISTALPEAAMEFWHTLETESRTHRDHLYPRDVTPGILTRIDVPDGMDQLAETYIRLAVTSFNAATMQRLALEANAAAEAGDTARISEIIGSITQLQQLLGTDILNEGLDELRDYARGQTEYLLFLYVTAQTPLSRARNDGRLPGQVARTGRMLSLSMRHLRTLTLKDTLDRLQGIEGAIEALQAIDRNSSEWAEGTDLFPLVDALQTGLARNQTIMEDVHAVQNEKVDPGSALYWILAAEQSGGGEARGQALASLGQVLRDLG